MSDLISRQAAIDEITEYGDSDIVYMSVGELKRRLEQLPPAQPERKTGKWILHKNGDGTCNQCRFRQSNIWDLDNWQNYCGHCGAHMTEAEGDDGGGA